MLHFIESIVIKKIKFGSDLQNIPFVCTHTEGEVDILCLSFS